jgi:hypothetical protein
MDALGSALHQDDVLLAELPLGFEARILDLIMAELTGFEPAISCVTGRHVRPLHHSSRFILVSHCSTTDVTSLGSSIDVESQLIWLRGQDLNLRPSGYEPDELPDCSTPRHLDYMVEDDGIEPPTPCL